MPWPSVAQSRLGPSAVVTRSFALEVQVGGRPGRPKACASTPYANRSASTVNATRSASTIMANVPGEEGVLLEGRGGGASLAHE